MIIRTVEVECGGEPHKISITNDGKLVFHNHHIDEVRLWRNLFYIGIDNIHCTCMGYLYHIGFASSRTGGSQPVSLWRNYAIPRRKFRNLVPFDPRALRFRKEFYGVDTSCPTISTRKEKAVLGVLDKILSEIEKRLEIDYRWTGLPIQIPASLDLLQSSNRSDGIHISIYRESMLVAPTLRWITKVYKFCGGRVDTTLICDVTNRHSSRVKLTGYRFFMDRSICMQRVVATATVVPNPPYSYVKNSLTDIETCHMGRIHRFPATL